MSNSIDLNREYIQKNELGIFKPQGLWYSVGSGNEWKEWCKDNMPDWVHENNFKLSVNESLMLVIDDVQGLISFNDMYSKPIYKDSFINCIDWKLVSKLYSGLEIRNYHSLKWNTAVCPLNMTWIYGWDVSSGCIWDLSVISDVEAL